MTIETYEQAIEYLFRRINYERIPGGSYTADDFKLDRMREFLALLGDPQAAVPVVHIAGTKGKGSTAAMTAAALTAAGYRTGLFTSPHITAYEERMQVDGRSPAPTELVELINAAAPFVADLDRRPGPMGPTYFELTTALAWLYFRREHVDIVVLEVGLGGRLDATNVCHPEVTAITSISRDHTKQLGSTLGQIAAEKAGIIKPGIPCICGAMAPAAVAAIAQIAAVHSAPLDLIGRDFSFELRTSRPAGNDVSRFGICCDVQTRCRAWPEVTTPLPGAHQAHNLAVTLSILERLSQQGWELPEATVRRGLATVNWPARVEVLQTDPLVIVDAAHNWAAITALLETLRSTFPSQRKILVFAGTRDKDVAGLLRQLVPAFDSIIVTAYQSNPRSLPQDELVRLTQRFGRIVHPVEDPASAWKLARRWAGPQDLICVTGSFFIAAEIRELLLDERRHAQSTTPELTS